MMKIAYILDSAEGGGVALPVPMVTRVLRNAGAQLEVFILTKRDGRAIAPMLADGLTVHVREGSGRDHIAAYRWLEQQLAAYQPNLLWTSLTRSTAIGLSLGKRLGIPVVCWQHNAFLQPLRELLLYFLRKRPVMWVGDSDMVSAETAKRFKVPAERLACWPLFAVTPDAPQSIPWQAGQTLRLGSIGRLHMQKGYDILIAALAQLKQRGFVAATPFELVIAGDGREQENLLEAAKQAGVADQIRFLGYAEHPRTFLSSLHLYLQPSRFEGFCIAMHEAMQASLPVIASRVGQMPYTIEANSSGWLVPPNDVNALADALAEALSHPERLSNMGQAARARVYPRYSAEAFQLAGENILARLEKQGIINLAK
ncbi:MAG: glycosyltransferase [Burkholderiaceae bacterium]|nr:glycosyltransferase [Burkholderiaceae bacterium]